MKKIMMMLAMAATMCATVFAQVNQEWAQTNLNNAKSNYEKAGWTFALEVAKQNPQSFDQIIKICEDAAAKFNISPDLIKWRTYWITTFMNDKVMKEGYEHAKKTNNSYVYHYVKNNGKKLGVSSEETVEVLSRYILNGTGNNVNSVKSGIDRIINEIGTWEDEEAAKAVLKKLNRVLSKNLLKDKATWEPVVAMIRTTLETY